MAMKKIILHGRFKELCQQSEIRLDVETVAEALEVLARQIPAFRSKPNQEKINCVVAGIVDAVDLYRPTDMEEIRLVPSLAGGKKGGFIKIAIGIALIAAAFYTGGASLSLTGGLSTTTLGGIALNIGMSLILGGFMELLSPVPKNDSVRSTQQLDPEASKYLGTPKNTVKIGTRIPILYGKRKVYGHYASFNIDAKDVAA